MGLALIYYSSYIQKLVNVRWKDLDCIANSNKYQKKKYGIQYHHSFAIALGKVCMFETIK